MPEVKIRARLTIRRMNGSRLSISPRMFRHVDIKQKQRVGQAYIFFYFSIRFFRCLRFTSQREEQPIAIVKRTSARRRSRLKSSRATRRGEREIYKTLSKLGVIKRRGTRREFESVSRGGLRKRAAAAAVDEICI